MTRTLLISCHPQHDSLTAAARAAALDGLRTAGHDVRVTDLYAVGFDPVLSAAEHAAHRDVTLPDDIAAHADDLRWCESLVLVYPTWWSAQPAMLKGWIDRVWINGVAWELPPGAKRLRPLLGNIRRITVVTTHGSPKWINALEGEAGKRTVTRSMRALCHWRCRTRWIALYAVDAGRAERRGRFLERVRRELQRR